MDLCSAFLAGVCVCFLVLKSNIDWRQVGGRLLDRYLPAKKETRKEESDAVRSD